MSTLGFIIDERVPIPPRKGRTPKADWRTWPFPDLEVGDSFFSSGVACTARFAALDYQKAHPGVRFTTRAFDEDPVTKLPGVRVWRIR